MFRSTTGATGSYTLIASTAATVTSYANTGLTGATEYCYQIRSFKTAGKNTTYSAYSGAVCATTLPPPVVAPSETDVVPQAYRIEVRWKDNSSDEDGFRIELAGLATGPWTQAATALANATVGYVYTLPEHYACFRVIAFNAIGPSFASAPDCTTLPASPTNLSAKSADLQSISLTWTDNSAVEDGYQVWRWEPEVTWWAVIATLPANAVSYRDASATANVTYGYRVQALKDGGYSDNSNEALGSIPTAPPSAPVYAHAGYDNSDYGSLLFDISWNDASTNEEGFRIEYSRDGVSGWAEYATTDANVSFLHERFSYDALPPGACYRVISFNVLGKSEPSNVTCAEPTGAPRDLVATAIDDQSINLSWTDNAALERGFAVVRSTAIEGPYDIVAGLPANSTSYRDTGLNSGQEYWYLVVVIYDDASVNENTNYSGFASATTSPAPTGVQTSPTVGIGRLTPARPIRVKRVQPFVPPLGVTRRVR